jgi:Flp pilus assembly protein TadG
MGKILAGRSRQRSPLTDHRYFFHTLMLQRRKFHNGQSAVEFALMAPAIVLLLVVGADVARAFSTASVLTNAARAGAQYGGQNRSTAADVAGMKTAASNDANGLAGFTSSASNFCLCNGSSVSCATAAGCVSNLQLYVKVTTNASLSTLLPYPGITRTLQLQGSSTILVPQ